MGEWKLQTVQPAAANGLQRLERIVAFLDKRGRLKRLCVREIGNVCDSTLPYGSL